MTTFDQTNNSFNQGVFFTNPVTAGPILMTASGLISESVSATGLLLIGGAYTVTIEGQLISNAAGSYGLSFDVAAPATPNQISTTTIGTTGEIYGASYAIAAFHAINVTNNGYLSGGNGIYVSGGAVNYTILNTGEIEAAGGGYAIWTNDAVNHTINNSGDITGHIVGNAVVASNETILNSGSLYGDIRAYGGIDTFNNSGSMFGTVYLDDGNDVLVNTGTITGNINGWNGADTIQNAGRLEGYLFGGTGNDTITNSGTILFNVDAGKANDTVRNTGNIVGWIFLGEGNDKLYGSANDDRVADEAGIDSYSLGDGNDNFDAVGTGSNVGNDILKGGANTGVNYALGIWGDEYNASDATNAVFINLDTVSRTDSVSGLAYAASRAEGVDTGIDALTEFEVAYTGTGNDVVFGNASANFIATGNGADHVFGGSGDDYLAAGLGVDFLAGDAGRDSLDGGIDATIDTFIYRTLSDSTVGRTGRDTLLNFTDADRIDFSTMVLATGDVNHYVGVDVAFDGLIGAVRALTTANGWTIQVDSNGDRVADMAIDVVDALHTAVVDWTDNFLY